ncbi:hypothetical protein F5Y16DRAFT_377220 [Xylariaceae sp. FL0255]|nr:hypothetical protein F5Y16DRAFT_377220 [Xylariaceae sp. FL0255]
MITKGPSVGAVCLRCRLNLLRQITPVRRFATEGENIDDKPANSSHEGHGTRRARIIYSQKKHVSGNRLLREARRNLDSEMLGKPTQIIVMKDEGNVLKRSAKYEEQSIDERDLHSQNLNDDIQALIENDGEPATVDEIRENIHQLQPPDKYLLEKDFRKLQHTLVDSFLSAQLVDYIEWHSATNTASQEIEVEALHNPQNSDEPYPEFPWIRSMSAWEALPTDDTAAQNVDPNLLGYVLPGTNPKEKIAISLMRDCWGLGISEMEHQLGEVNIVLRKFEFTMLMRGTQRFVAHLSRITLDDGEKIEAFRNKSILRLVTTKAKYYSVILGLHDILQKIKQKTLPLKMLGTKDIDDKVLEEVGAITHTSVRKSHTGNRLHVTWIDTQPSEIEGYQKLEDKRDIVTRLLLTSYTDHTTSALKALPGPNQDGGRLLRNMIDNEKLTWRDRLSQWARYVLPQAVEKKTASTSKDLTALDFSLPFKPSPPATGYPTIDFSYYLRWSKELCTNTKATFGSILHQHDPATGSPNKSLSDLVESTGRHIFCPATAHPTYISAIDALSTSFRPVSVPSKSTAVMRFWPSPSTNANEPAPPAPVLELRIACSDSGITGIESFRAIKHTNHTDVMLPNTTVDVRFTQEQYEEIQAQDLMTLAKWYPLADFLRNSRIDFAAGKIEVPSIQKFPIPRRLLTGDYEPPHTKPARVAPHEDDGLISKLMSLSDNSYFQSDNALMPFMRRTYKKLFHGQTQDLVPKITDTKPSDNEIQPHAPYMNDDLLSVTYMYVGTELHKSVIQNYERHQMTYTSIEGGQGGGRRTEVILEPLALPASTRKDPSNEIIHPSLDFNKFIQGMSSSDDDDNTGAEETTSPSPTDTETEPELTAEEVHNKKLQKDFLACCARLAANQPIWSGMHHVDRYTPY